MIIKEQIPNMIDKEPENITLSDAQKTFNSIYSQYSQDLGTTATMTAAIQSGMESIKEIPAGLQQTLGQELYSLGESVDTVLPVKKVLPKILPENNKIYNANNDLTLGDVLKKAGEWQIETANRNLDTMRREYMNSAVNISEDELNSWTYKITSGGLQYGTMLGLGMINPNLAMSYMGALTLGSESIEGADKYKERTGSIEGFAKESSKELALNVGNTAVQLFTEKLFGIPAQLKRFRSAKDFFKAGFRGALDEFGTENLQNLEDAIFDYMGNRFDEDETILTRMQDNFRDTLVAAMFGGGAGMSFAIYNRSKGIQDIKENLISPDVPEYQKEELATKVYDKNIETLQNALTSELELSSELRAKYGERYDKLKQEIHNQIKDAGAYSNYTEDQIAQYVEATSKNFADQILAESTKRKVLMDDIVKSSQIVYDNGRLYLQGVTEEEKTKKTKREKTQKRIEKQAESILNPQKTELSYEEIVRKLRYEDLTEEQETNLQEMLEKEEDRLRPLLDTAQDVALEIDNEFGLQPGDIASAITEKRLNFKEVQDLWGDYLPYNDLELLGEKIKERDNKNGDPAKIGYDYYTEKVYDAFDDINAKANNYILLQQSFDVSDENARLDDIYPEYKGETININGIDKTVYNSSGERIAKSKEALENFYRWFGDSKVVDEQGRPLVVYHGTRQKGITEFKSPYADKLIFFAYKKEFADNWAKNAPLTEEQTQIYRDMPNFSIEVSRKYREKYGENWAEDESLIQEAREERDNLKQEYLRNAGIEEITMPVYLKAENTFRPAEHWDLVIDEIEKYYDKDYRDENADAQTKEYLKQIQDGKWIFFEHENVINKIRELGFDSIELEEISGQGVTTIAVFEGNNQIKSTQNRGTFSSDSDNIYYQSAYVSMKGELEGEFLDADRFEGTGEGNAAHGWGNYLLKDRETNKAHYYDWMSDDKVFYNGVEVMQHDDMPIRYAAREFAYAKDIEEAKKNIEEAIDKARIDIAEEEKHIKFLGKEYGVSEEEIELLKQLKDVLDSYYELSIIDAEGAKLTQQEAENKLSENAKNEADRFYMAFDNLDSATRRYNGYKEALNLDLSKFEKVKTGAQYEADVPEDKYLLDEDKFFDKQSKIVKDAVSEIAQEMGGRFNETKLRKLTNDEPVGSSSENWKTYYGKRAFRYGKKHALDSIHNDQEGILEQELIAFINNLDFEAISDKRNFSDYTGKEIYQELDNYYGSKKEASKTLEKYGVKGIKYDGDRDGIGYVIFKGEDAPIVRRLLQKQKEKIKGSFDRLTKSIKITKEADFSTYQHEFAHFWLDNIWDYMHSGLASPEYTKQWREVMRWLGVKDDDQYPTRKHHEKFARAYEKYLVNGEVPNSIMGEAFNKYENFIKEVYDSMRDVDERAGKKYEPLSVAMYDFFDSMVTGKLPMPEGMAEKMTVEQTREAVNKNTAEAKEFVIEEKKILEENRANYNLKPAETSTKKSYLTSLEKTTGELVEAGTTTNEEQIKRATEFVNNNIDKAERIINGEELPPDGILTNAIFMAYNEYQKRLGNDDKRANALINQANQLRRMGQEIQSQSMAYKGIEKFASAEYWIRSVTANRIQKIADANKMTVSEAQDKINSLIKSGYNDNMKPDDIVKKIGEELGITEFYQTDYTDLNSYKAVEKYVEERIGTSLTIEQARNIITRADNIGKDIENSSSVTGNPSVDFFVKLKELEDYANSLSPSSNLRVLVSIVGRGNLLLGLKSSLTNIISNTSHSIYRHILRRINLQQNTDFISNDKKKAVYDYSWEIFKKTGYNVNNMQEDINTYLGESITHSQGEGKIRALGRFYENLIFKWSLGAGDVYFKDRAFVDYLALKASKEGKTAEKANKLFDDAILIEPKTEDGKRLRQEAIEESLITTFQNKGIISEKALKARSSFDFGAGFGEAIAPFVKTPANVVGVGLEAGFGGVKAVASEIIRDIKAGKIQKPTQENIKLMVNNGLGLVLAFLLTANLDDDDYMPAYAMATSKDKQLAKQLNIPFNAIRIGNTWFSLDYLGPLASPIVGVLQAKREDGFLNKVFGYSKSAGIQSLTLPAFGNIADIFENIKNSLRKTADDIIPDTVDSLIGQVYSRLTPAIISDIAKAFDDYDREAKDHRIMAKIPFVREKLEKKINLTSGKAEKIDNAIIDIFAGSRVKVQVRNKVADEFSRLNNAGYGVSLTDVTQRGLLSTVSEPYKKEIREKFAREYAKEVNKLINSPLYKRKSDEDKKESIDKVKRKIVEVLKKQYLKKAK